MPRNRGYILPLRIRRLDDGRFLARSPSLPGLNVQDDTIEDVVNLAPAIARELIAAMREKGVPLPDGLTTASAPITVEVLVPA